MKRTNSYLITLSLIFFASISICNAQISNGGSPYSIMFQLNNNFTDMSFTSPDISKISTEDILNESTNPNTPHRMGVSILVNKNLCNSGTVTEIKDVGKIWQLKLKIKDAKALGVYYDTFYIPDGGELFLYNHDKSQILGAYTHKNNPTDNLFATEFIQGDEVTLEYFQPKDITEEAIINISEIAYAYREIEFMYNKEVDSWYCMINVACEEGDNWQNQIKGAARMSIKIGSNYYWCSGSLINNTSNDRTPYFLSAAHCGEGSNAGDRNQWIFYFNYEASTCNGSSSGSNSMTGCQLKANDPSFADAGSDFYLVEFNNTIPVSYDVFYNGWNRTNSADDAGSGVGIHHPAGDIKKISTYNTPLSPSTYWNGLPSHWKLLWAETTNGKSIMQGGSSGSPIFDSNGLIMGDLTGGYQSNSCTTPSPAYYGKLWYSWDQNGTTTSTQLKSWLDPDNTGIEKLPGVSWETIPPIADYEVNASEITQGDTVFFTDLSGPGILEWDWLFDGGNPASSTVKNPYTIYADTGYYSISLTVENADGTDTETKTNYIHVNQLTLPEAEFEANITNVTPGGTVIFSDLSTGNPTEWEWTLEGASPATSSNQNTVVRYNVEGVYDVVLKATNLGGSTTLLKEDYIIVGTVGNIETEIDDIRIYPNPGNGIFTINFGSIESKIQRVEVVDANGNTIYQKLNPQTNDKFKLDLSVQPSGLYLVNIIKDEVIISKTISIVR